ncbi:Mov34/MPN/PAD-1 family protein [bacterium]|nr:Mov34/MPN/PAD-1 family protein [bacterium]
MSEQCNVIVFSDKAYNAIIDETFRKHPLETGGILLGHVLDNGAWIVMEVLPPGPNSVHQSAFFEYDEKFVNYLANSVASKYEIPLSMLGLWHRHPGSYDEFSSVDDGTNLKFAKLSKVGAISGLVNIDPEFRFKMRHVTDPLHYEVVNFEVGDDIIPSEYFTLKYIKESMPQIPSEIPENAEKNCSYIMERSEFPEEKIVSDNGKVSEVYSDDITALITRLDAIVENTRNTNSMLKVIVENTSDKNSLIEKFVKKAQRGYNMSYRLLKKHKKDVESK